MDQRAAKLALARKKLQDHQEKKLSSEKVENIDTPLIKNSEHVSYSAEEKEYQVIQEQHQETNKNQNLIKEVNITEVLISSKRKLELQVNELQSSISELQEERSKLLKSNSSHKESIQYLESQIEKVNNENLKLSEELHTKSELIQELHKYKQTLTEKYNNLTEQLEFSNNILSEKQSENLKLKTDIATLQNKIDVIELQLKQVNGKDPQYIHKSSETEHMRQKLIRLEQQFKTLQKEKEQMQLHYEHYVKELNDQLKFAVTKNEELVKSVNNLSDREKDLVDQISEMEIRLINYQNYVQAHSDAESISKADVNELQQSYAYLQAQYQDICENYEKIKIKYDESEEKIKVLTEEKAKLDKQEISLSKLNSDIASDKIAVQKATEQNRKMKMDIQELQEAFVKISNDKLLLVEKLEAEKFLNRELTLKLSETEAKAKDLHTKLIAKDEEMIRLQVSYRDVNAKYEELLQKSCVESNSSLVSLENLYHQCNTKSKEELNQENLTDSAPANPKQDAMSKLQQRFLKIMDEVANLSDEKHRLEHIILQLQSETDTICEYVALYQHQRSVLKQRDEERSAQIKIYQTECELLKNKLKELNDTFERIRRDEELVTYFRKKDELAKILNLLGDIRNSAVIDPKNNCPGLKDFYPCNCCSGQLIDV